MLSTRLLIAACLSAAGLVLCPPPAASAERENGARPLESLFADPPALARVRGWWHRPAGIATREGITQDLEWMAAEGLGGATIFSLGRNQVLPGNAPDPKLDAPYASDAWVAMVRHAADEAQRLGLSLGMNNCDGWATSGGPWITPQEAMKEVVFSRLAVFGGVTGPLELPQPHVKEGFYRDVAVFAYPSTRPLRSAMHEAEPELVFTGKRPAERLDAAADADPATSAELREVRQKGKRSIPALELRFDEPFEAASVVISTGYERSQNVFVIGRAFVDAADGKGGWRPIAEFPLRDRTTVARFDAVEAEAFRLRVDDFNSPHWPRNALVLTDVELLPPGAASAVAAPVADAEAKSGAKLRMRPYAEPGTEDAVQNPGDPPVIDPAELIELTDRLNDDGTLDWDAPAGDWTILRVGFTATGHRTNPATDAGRGLEVDKINPIGIEAHWDRFLAPTLDGLGPVVGKSFDHLTVDSWEAGVQTWSENLEEEFAERRGYPLRPKLPALAGEVVGGVADTEAFLADFRRTLAELIAENFYGRFDELCRSRGLDLHAEAAGSQNYLADAVNNQRRVSVPMTEFWVKPNEPNNFSYQTKRGQLETVAAAHLFAQERVAAEAFTSGRGNWLHTPAVLKPYADAAFCIGINALYVHSMTHQPDDRSPGWTMRPWGIAFNRKLTWAAQVDPWAAYLARCQALLQAGNPVGDLAVLLPSDHPTFFNLDQQTTDILRLPHRGYRITVVSPSVLDDLKVEGGRLVAPSGMSFAAIDTRFGTPISDVTQAALDRLAAAGASVGDKGRQLMKRAGVEEDFDFKRGGKLSGAGRDSVRYLHRSRGGDDWYFVAQLEREPISLATTFRQPTGREVELRDPVTGRIAAAAGVEARGGRTVVPLDLPPAGSVFVVFRDAATPGREEAAAPEPAGGGVAVQGPWKVTFEETAEGGLTRELAELTSWHKLDGDAIRFHSGAATYATTLKHAGGEPAVLALGEVETLAEVRPNGELVATLWTPPFRVDLGPALRPGENRLEVRVVNLWPNRLIGDARQPESGSTWTNNDQMWSKKDKLLTSGLLGPVRLLPGPAGLGVAAAAGAGG